MTDTADQTAPAARDDQPQAPGETPEELLAEPLEMPAPGPAPAGFRFPTDAELMDGPNPLTDPDDEEDGEEERAGEEVLGGHEPLGRVQQEHGPRGQDDDSQPQPHPVGDKKRDEVDRCDQREGQHHDATDETSDGRGLLPRGGGCGRHYLRVLSRSGKAV